MDQDSKFMTEAVGYNFNGVRLFSDPLHILKRARSRVVDKYTVLMVAEDGIGKLDIISKDNLKYWLQRSVAIYYPATRS